MSTPLPAFWIDVGGTFTDCLMRRPDGQVVRHKLLSSGVIKGSVDEGSTDDTIVDPLRQNDPNSFYDGYSLRLLDRQGGVLAESTVAGFDAGRLMLADRLAVPANGTSYELSSGEEAPIVAVRYLLGLRLTDPIPPVTMRLGTTRGTNALLTRTGAKTALITTRGFGDILHIGYQNRPKLFDLTIVKPPPLFEQVIEIGERLTPDGRVLEPINDEEVRQLLTGLKSWGIESLAICLLNAYADDRHERVVEQIAREVGFTEISTSSRIAPLIKLVSRGDTTVADAYLNPVLREYVAGLKASLYDGPPSPSTETLSTASEGRRTQLRILTSAGGLVDAETFVGKDSILSGPAGGVVGFAVAAQAAGFDQAIGFDMGGTSTDVARFDGRFEREYETEKAGVRIVAPMMAIETVAAGGGSVCWFDGVKLRVGPNSAGAEPGPACYGRGGPLTVTDMNLTLGKLLPDRFPFRLDSEAVQQRLTELIDEIAAASGRAYEPRELAEGFVNIANAKMAAAIASVSLAKGFDPADYVLAAFGGAAGQHACAIADELGIQRILSHPAAGVLSAYGIGRAAVERHQVEGIYRPLSEVTGEPLSQLLQRLCDAAVAEVAAEGIECESVTATCSLDLRYAGLDSYLTTSLPDERGSDAWRGEYERQHRQLYGYTHDDKPIEVVAARVTAVGGAGDPPPRGERVSPTTQPMATGTTSMWFSGQPFDAEVFDREAMTPGDHVNGPVIVLEEVATTIIDPGWQAEMLSDGQLLISRSRPPAGTCGSDQLTTTGQAASGPVEPTGPTADPVLLEIFNNHFAAIAGQMGITLRNTASSVNVKERLDFSCAIFTAAGELVVNAPHIPVHLGAMGLTVRGVLEDNPAMRPGDVYVTNDPYRGGSHLPDITVVTPVFDETSGELIFFTASRAHHAEIGGIRAGSMPPRSQNLAEEGVLIRNFKLLDAGQPRWDDLRELLLSGEHPTRNVDDNLADVAAQVAANQQGARDLRRLVQRYSLPTVAAYMSHIQAAAETKVRAALANLPDGTRRFTDHLDDGSPIAVAIILSRSRPPAGTCSSNQAATGEEFKADRNAHSATGPVGPTGPTLRIDFTGTGAVLPGNLNANRAIVTAAVMYVLRCLIDEDIPLNEGVLAPVEIVLPECLLSPPPHNDPARCAAVAGGNVETSQRIVDVLLGALGLAAASQGTMNNLLFGDHTFGYYETIGGGGGATPDGPGAAAVHTHMTNTRLTDPEVLEKRYPVRVRQFAIRRGSGGQGRQPGGDGIVRQIEFLKRLEVSLLTSRRGDFLPYGIHDGQPGAAGRNTLVRANGAREDLAGQVQFTAEPGDQLIIETPGGGGAGNPGGM